MVKFILKFNQIQSGANNVYFFLQISLSEMKMLRCKMRVKYGVSREDRGKRKEDSEE